MEIRFIVLLGCIGLFMQVSYSQNQLDQKSSTTSIGSGQVNGQKYQHFTTIGQSVQSGGTFEIQGFSSTLGFLTPDLSRLDLPPVAAAGGDIEVISENLNVSLDGSSSFDPENNNLTYKWRIVGEGILSDSTVVNPELSFEEVKAVRHFMVELVVCDGKSFSRPDTVEITVINPEWEPKIVTNSTSFYGIALLNDTTNTTEEDYVGAFVDGESRGLTRVKYINDQPFVLMNIQVENTSDVHFRIYDYDEDQICAISNPVLVAPGTDVGSPAQPKKLIGNCVPCIFSEDGITLLGLDNYCDEGFLEAEFIESLPDGATFSWSTGETTPRVENVGAGIYEFSVNYFNCEVTKTITIGETSTLKVFAEVIEETECGSANGIAEVNISGGIGPYSILWENGDNVIRTEKLFAGLNKVTIRDANGCTIEEEVFGGPADFPIISMVQVEDFNNCANGQKDTIFGAISISVFEGAEPFKFNWNNGSTSQNIEGLSPGSYNLTLTDANGCIAILDSVEIENVCVVGVEDIESSEILQYKIFPNPFSNYLNVFFEFQQRIDGQLLLYDFNGRLLKKEVFKNKILDQQLDSGNLSSGVYFLEIRVGNLIRRFPVIKK